MSLDGNVTNENAPKAGTFEANEPSPDALSDNQDSSVRTPDNSVSEEYVRAGLMSAAATRRTDPVDFRDKIIAKKLLERSWLKEEYERKVAAALLVRVAPDATTAQLAMFLRGGEKLIDAARPKGGFAELANQLANAPSAAIDALNRQYAWVEMRGRLLLVGEDKIRYMRVENFTTTYNNQRFEGDPLGTAWLQHKDRRSYRDTGLYPPPLVGPGDHYNLWRGFVVMPKVGDWTLMRAHIRDVIAGNDPALDAYVIRWIAWALQNPGLQAEVALVLLGKKGTGKGTLGKVLKRIFGSHAAHITNPKHFAGSNFNAHLAGAVFLFADECYWPGTKAHEGSLKGMITENTIFIEPKGPSRNNLTTGRQCWVALDMEQVA